MNELEKLNEEIKSAYESYIERVESILIGKKVRITGFYNGQSYGVSKKSIKGQVKEITRVFVDGDGIYVSIKGFEYGSPMLCIQEFELV